MYARQLAIGATRDRVFEAVGTVDGPRHWWTTIVTGSAALGGELRFGFAGLDEQIVMRVEALRAPSLVAWDHFLASLSACLEHGTGTPFGA
jgi:uncharacterized protein YndB with AHSA1/START domain